MENIILLLYILIVLCGINNLIIDLLKSKTKIRERPLVYNAIDKIFYYCNLPAAFISFLFVFFSFFYNSEGIFALVVFSVTAAFSFAVERIREYLNLPTVPVQAKNNEPSEHKAFFACMESYNTIQKFHESIFSGISEYRTAFFNKAENAVSALIRAASDISDYTTRQDKQNHEMLDNKKSCEAAFMQLRESADRYCAAFTNLEKKLSATNMGIEYSLYNSENLQNDLDTSFKELFLRNSLEARTQIDGIISSLNNLVYKCSQFPVLSKPYQNIISIYSTRMESALVAFEVKNRKLQNTFNAIINSISAHETIFQRMVVRLEQNTVALSKVLVKYKEKIDERLAAYHKEHNTKLEALNTEKKRWKKRFVVVMTLSISGLALLMGIGIYKLTGPASISIQLIREKRELQKEYNEMEKSYSELQANSTNELMESQTKSNESLVTLQKRYNELNAEKNTLQTRSNELQKNYNDLQKRNTDLQTRNNELQTSYNSVNKIFNLMITTIRVGNWNNGWLTTPGSYLYASNMRFFTPRIVYNSNVSGTYTFYAKIINPRGEVFRNTNSSPDGFTNRTSININAGQNQTVDLTGWGNSNSSSYSKGIWTVEVWCEGICLKSEKIQLN